MRSMAILFCIAVCACAANSGVAERRAALDARLNSWVGANPEELAASLGDPDFRTERLWTWRYTGPGMGEASNVNSLVEHANTHCRTSESSQVTAVPGDCSNPGFESRRLEGPGSTAVSRKDCRYYAHIDDGVITRLEAAAVAGRCAFNRLQAHDG